VQSDIAITDGKVTGTLTFIEGGLAETGPLSEDGHFLVLKWSDPAEDITSLKVGLEPSEGTGLVECIDDTDRNGVFKVANNGQKLILLQSDGNGKRWQYLDLSGLVLAEPEEVEGT